MKILALDTSTNACSVALLEGKQEDFSTIERFEIAPRQHTQLILPMLDAVLQEAGYQINDIDSLAFGCGPGAFTGVRIATGVIQAIAYGADVPVAQISSLAAIAQGVYQHTILAHESTHWAEKILVASDARMAEIYFAAYEIEQGFMTLKGNECVIKPELLQQTLSQYEFIDQLWSMIGNGWSVYQPQLHTLAASCHTLSYADELMEQLSYPQAKNIAYLAFKEIAEGKLLAAAQVSPVYLRNNVAKKPKNLYK